MPEMKDTSIDWIGKIPKNWNLIRLKNASTLKGRIGWQGLRTDEYRDEGPFLITGTDFSNGIINWESCAHISEERFAMDLNIQIKENDLLVTKDGTIGKTAIAKNCPEKVSLNSGVFIVRNDRKYKYYSKYFYYIMLSNQFVLWYDLNQQGNSTIRHLTQDRFYNFLFTYPPLDEQKKIAGFLDKKCSEIELLNEDICNEIRILEEYKKTIVKEAVTKGLVSDVNMKDSHIEWIGMMPEHWECIKGKYVLKYLQKPVKEDDGVVTCFRDGEVTLRSNRREEGYTMSDKEIGYQGVDIGDLVVHGMDGFAGSIGISDSRGKASPVLNVLDTDMDKKYVMYYLRSMAYSDVFLALATGIRVRSCDLRWNKLAELLYPVPPKEEQIAISQYIDKTIEETNKIIELKKQQLEILDEYKKSLIYEYVTGKKEVPAV